MNDREFIELLNLYVDREIGAQDALRLEAEVLAHPRRREIYDQYCRMQKACSMLSDDLLDASPAGVDSNVISFPSRSQWRLGPFAAGLAAAAACAVVIVTVKFRSAEAFASHDQAPVAVSGPRPVADSAALTANSEPMKPVFFARLPSDQASHAAQRSLFAPADATAQIAELSWIGDVHVPPVFTAANSEFLMNPRTDIKAAALADAQNSRDPQEPAEMTAFRFQR
jgi:hypothetical protein